MANNAVLPVFSGNYASQAWRRLRLTRLESAVDKELVTGTAHVFDEPDMEAWQ